MASRNGPRVLGTDGNDYSHRERVANHYIISTTNKSRFRYTIYLHFALVLLMIIRLSVAILVFLNMRPPPFLQRLRLPRASPWEFVWLASVVASIFGLISLRKNRQLLMQQFIVGWIVFGIIPITYIMYTLKDDLLQYWETRKTTRSFLGYPVSVLWSMFGIVCLQLHFFGIFFAWNLLKAWKPRPDKKKI